VAEDERLPVERAKGNKALVDALAELQNPLTDSRADIRTDKGSFSYNYASLPAIMNLVRPVLAKHGFAIVQSVSSREGQVGVQTRILPAGIESEWLFLPAGPTPQTAGSAITYARRYSLCALLGIAADEDDDGSSASSGEVGAGQAGPGETSSAKTESSPGPAPKFTVKASDCEHLVVVDMGDGYEGEPTFTWASTVQVGGQPRCSLCGTPAVKYMETTEVDLGPA
jgi:hypothetical protein